MRLAAVRFLPSLIRPEDLSGTCVIMTDVLRASSTIISALANGANQVIPQAEIADSIAKANELREASSRGVLIGGERGGKIIDGFNAGNSPLEYGRDKVEGRDIVLCTSNGTWALGFCRGADRILIGAFNNLSAVVAEASKSERVLVCCAGTDRYITAEDALFAGAVVDRIANDSGVDGSGIQLDDPALIVRSQWVVAQQNLKDHNMRQLLSNTKGGINLLNLNYDHDVEFCSRIDEVAVVPELDQNTWTIRLVEC